MGQRLVIDLIKDDKVVAAVYYHWSAYFCSTIYELGKLSKAILKAEEKGKDKLFAVLQMLEQDEIHTQYNGEHIVRRGGVCGKPEEIKAAAELFPNYFPKTNVDRNCGLMAFTEEGIKDLHDWEEGHAEIDLDTLEITNNVDLDPEPFMFDATYCEDEYGYKYVEEFNSGKILINGKISPVDAFDCDCKSILELIDWMKKEYQILRAQNTETTMPLEPF